MSPDALSVSWPPLVNVGSPATVGSRFGQARSEKHSYKLMNLEFQQRFAFTVSPGDTIAGALFGR